MSDTLIKNVFDAALKAYMRGAIVFTSCRRTSLQEEITHVYTTDEYQGLVLYRFIHKENGDIAVQRQDKGVLDLLSKEPRNPPLAERK